MVIVNNKNTSIKTYFTPFSSVSVVDFEQVNVILQYLWVRFQLQLLKFQIFHLFRARNFLTR